METERKDAMNVSQCPVCSSLNTANFIQIKDLPLLIFPVDKEVKNDIAVKDIASSVCNDCRHVFLPPLSSDEIELIYGEYYKYYPLENLESMQTAYRQPFDDFIEKVVRNHKLHKVGNTLLEIGCSSGTKLDSYKKYGFRCWGIDPSPLNKDNSGKIKSGIYEEYSFDESFDIIISCFSFEHINDPSHFCKKIWKDLADGGVVFVQVPNVPEYCRTSMPFFLAHEHVHYFNAYSLEHVFIKHGFLPLDFVYENSNSLMIALQKGQQPSLAKTEKLPVTFYSDYLGTRQEFKEQAISLIETYYEKLCFYGAGLSMCWLLYDLNLPRYCTHGFVIDDNPVLQGRYFPKTDYCIKSFNADAIDSSEAILLTLNPTYHPVSISKIRVSGYTGKIFTINENGLHEVGGL